MAIEKTIYNDPIIDAIPCPMIASFTADADVEAGQLAYLDSNGAITAISTDNALFGLILDTAAEGEAAQVFYHGYAGNKWGLTDAQRYRLAGVGVIIRPYV